MSADSSAGASTRQRVATLIGKGLFIVGVLGFVLAFTEIPILLGADRGDVDWPLVEPTIAQVVVLVVLSLGVAIVGETIGREYGTWSDADESEA